MSEPIVPPLAIYVHLPWCVRKCPYCDFNSHPAHGSIPETRYIDALLSDLRAQAPAVGNREIVSVFFGGGTPSLFQPSAIGQLIAAIRQQLHCSPQLEVTMEANPGTIERGRFAEYRAAGVNRVSLGGQSFNAAHLQALGRIHSSEETVRAAQELHAAGLENFNIDLMYGLPGQSVGQALDDIRAAIALGPAHLSHYQLTMEPGTAFFHRPPQLPDEDSTWQMQLQCQELLAHSGFAQYEVSAYARSSHRCAHNLNYWRFGDYLGLGAGAHGKITRSIVPADIVRTTQPLHPLRYMEAQEAGDTRPEVRTVAPEDLPFEFMLNALRLVEGFSVDVFEARTGLGIATLATQLQPAVARGLLQETADPGWKPTANGLRFLNELQMLFLPSEKPAANRA